MALRINFDILERENWHYELPPESDTWFTGGSKSGAEAGAGIYGEN